MPTHVRSHTYGGQQNSGHSVTFKTRKCESIRDIRTKSESSSLRLSENQNPHFKRVRLESKAESTYTSQWKDANWTQRILFWRRDTINKLRTARKIIPNHVKNIYAAKGKKKVNPDEKYPGNQIRTSKYTLLSFIPKNLYEQFHRLANLFFISMVLLGFIMDVFGKEVNMIPLIFVLSVTAIKDVFEDKARRKSDRKTNNSKGYVYNSELNGYILTKWKKMRVGDMVRLASDHEIPADILVLRSTDPNGLCYLDSSNLDGESNLKQRQVVRGFADKGDTFEAGKFQSEIEVCPPSSNLENFSGVITHKKGTAAPLVKENLLLRGSILRNTEFVEGMIVYAGKETKAMLNNSGPRLKRTQLEIRANKGVLWCVVILATICVICTVGSVIWAQHYGDPKIPFMDGLRDDDYSPFDDVVLNFLHFVYLFQGIIPLSLYVTIEFAKRMQIFHIQHDIKLYDEETNKKIKCRAMNITEDLGVIQYIFSDKTGTLTENEMIFRSCTIASNDYDHSAENPEDQPTRTLDMKVNPALKAILDQPSEIISSFPSDEYQRAHDFLIALATCNTVVVAKTLDGASASAQSVFQAESSDELALVEAAYVYQYKLLQRTPNYVKVDILGKGVVEYEVLNILPFDSTRKRMSIILKDPSNPNHILVYCKGADSTMFPNLRRDPFNDNLTQTQANIDNYARKGLRILVIAKRILSVQEYTEWLIKYRQTELDLNNRESMLSRLYSSIEQNLELVGATGIEDRLQAGVPETIDALRQAGIIVWVLTGDKQETAVNIAHSSKLFSEDMDIISLNAGSREKVKEKLAYYTQQIQNIQDGRPSSSDHTPPTTWQRAGSTRTGPLTKKERALVLDGTTLRIILDSHTNLLEPFLNLSVKCSSVLCCRATPLQKAHIVGSVKDILKARTLSIGDGANDVPMIQRANIGIGISGKEGMQAVMASDFAIPKFRYLQRLLLVHGHWCYDRLARMILYFFYKTTMWVLSMFWVQILTGWSATAMIDPMYSTVFSLLFTSLPPLAIGIYDQNASSDLLMANPKLYAQQIKKEEYQNSVFWITIADAVYQSVVIFFIPFGVYNGSDEGVLELGTLLVLSSMLVMLVHAMVESKSWTIIHIIFAALSILAFYMFAFIYNILPVSMFTYEHPYWVIYKLVASPLHWLTVLLTIVLAVLPRITLIALHNTFYPSELMKTLLHQRRFDN